MMSPTRTAANREFQNCPCVGATLDKLIQPAILTVLAEGPLHGYQLAERIGNTPMLGGHRPDISGIYRFLKSMERKELVVSSWDLSESGPAKRAYRLTPAGKKCLRRWIDTLQEYRDGIATLLKMAKKATAE
jgi:PadR family transcriptional regulator, regulatory protein PadR